MKCDPLAVPSCVGYLVNGVSEYNMKYEVCATAGEIVHHRAGRV